MSTIFFKNLGQKRTLCACPRVEESLEGDLGLTQGSRRESTPAKCAEKFRSSMRPFTLLLKDSVALPNASETSVCLVLQVFSYEVEKITS